MAVTTSQCLLVDAMSVDAARRLVAALGGIRAELSSTGGDLCQVAIELDRDNEGWLDGVLGALQGWLAGSSLAMCRVRLDGRSYVLERPAP